LKRLPRKVFVKKMLKGKNRLTRRKGRRSLMTRKHLRYCSRLKTLLLVKMRRLPSSMRRYLS
jgi:hypothetical protein